MGLQRNSRRTKRVAIPPLKRVELFRKEQTLRQQAFKLARRCRQ